MSVESYQRASTQPSVYEGLPEAWFDSTAIIGESRDFRAPYAFKETWQNIVTDLERIDDPTAEEYPQSWWQGEAVCWPPPYESKGYLGAVYKNFKHTQDLIVYWDDARYYDVIDTLDTVPGASILKAIVEAQAYRGYRQEALHKPNIEISVETRPVLSENKPLEQQIKRYKKRDNVPQHTLRLPFSTVRYVWTPQRDAFLADYSLRPNMPGNPAEVSTDEFFEIARVIAALIIAE